MAAPLGLRPETTEGRGRQTTWIGQAPPPVGRSNGTLQRQPAWRARGVSARRTTRPLRPHPAAGGRESGVRESGVRDQGNGRDRTKTAAMLPSPQPSPAATSALLTGDRVAGEGASAAVPRGMDGGELRVPRRAGIRRVPRPPCGGRGWPIGRVRGLTVRSMTDVRETNPGWRRGADLCVRSAGHSSEKTVPMGRLKPWIGLLLALGIQPKTPFE